MPLCTDIAPDPRLPGYRVVDVDRGRFASLPAEALELLNLAPGREIPPMAFARLQELADVEAAYRAAVRLERLRGHARADLRRRLVMKQHPPAAADAALARLAEQGLIDDRRFAEAFTRARMARGRGAARLIRDLLALGVERGLAESVVAQVLEAEGVDPAQAARAVAERRARQLAGLEPVARRRRLTAYLLRRGFAGREVRDLVRELCAR
ncbi:MAG TPA: regulatory protein RecX [Gemmatimonadales bacterium]